MPGRFGDDLVGHGADQVSVPELSERVSKSSYSFACTSTTKRALASSCSNWRLSASKRAILSACGSLIVSGRMPHMSSTERARVADEATMVMYHYLMSAPIAASPLVSVCVPTYNNATTIERCLNSILSQNGVFEILVVDDDSSDDTVAMAATMLRDGDRIVRNTSRLGAHQNHTKCIELARGSYIQFVHGDDCLLPGALQTLVQYFDDPAVGLAFAPRRVVTEDLLWLRYCGTLHTRFSRLEEYNHGPSLVLQMALHGFARNWIGEATNVMFRRQLAIDAGGIRNDIVHLSDLELWLRLLLRSAACFVPRELSVRYHTAFAPYYLATRPWWLDQLRILTWMIVDPASPAVVRIIAGAWWLPVWLQLTTEVLAYGPERWSRIRILAAAPFREFAHAWRLRKAM